MISFGAGSYECAAWTGCRFSATAGAADAAGRVADGAAASPLATGADCGRSGTPLGVLGLLAGLTASAAEGGRGGGGSGFFAVATLAQLGGISMRRAPAHALPGLPRVDVVCQSVPLLRVPSPPTSFTLQGCSERACGGDLAVTHSTGFHSAPLRWPCLAARSGSLLCRSALWGCGSEQAGCVTARGEGVTDAVGKGWTSAPVHVTFLWLTRRTPAGCEITPAATVSKAHWWLTATRVHPAVQVLGRAARARAPREHETPKLVCVRSARSRTMSRPPSASTRPQSRVKSGYTGFVPGVLRNEGPDSTAGTPKLSAFLIALGMCACRRNT